MTTHTTAQLAEVRRGELIAAATYHRQSRPQRTRRPGPRSRTHLRRPIAAFHDWLAAGQL